MTLVGTFFISDVNTVNTLKRHMWSGKVNKYLMAHFHLEESVVWNVAATKLEMTVWKINVWRFLVVLHIITVGALFINQTNYNREMLSNLNFPNGCRTNKHQKYENIKISIWNVSFFNTAYIWPYTFIQHNLWICIFFYHRIWALVFKIILGLY